MTIIEADTVGIHLKEAVWWFEGWCKLQEHEGLVYWLPTYRDNALRHLDLAILELRRSDERVLDEAMIIKAASSLGYPAETPSGMEGTPDAT